MIDRFIGTCNHRCPQDFFRGGQIRGQVPSGVSRHSPAWGPGAKPPKAA